MSLHKKFVQGVEVDPVLYDAFQLEFELVRSTDLFIQLGMGVAEPLRDESQSQAAIQGGRILDLQFGCLDIDFKVCRLVLRPG